MFKPKLRTVSGCGYTPPRFCGCTAIRLSDNVLFDTRYLARNAAAFLTRPSFIATATAVSARSGLPVKPQLRSPQGAAHGGHPSTRQGAATAGSARSSNCSLCMERQLRSRAPLEPEKTATRRPLSLVIIISISTSVSFCIYVYVYLQLRCNMRGSAATAGAWSE